MQIWDYPCGYSKVCNTLQCASRCPCRWHFCLLTAAVWASSLWLQQRLNWLGTHSVRHRFCCSAVPWVPLPSPRGSGAVLSERLSHLNCEWYCSRLISNLLWYTLQHINNQSQGRQQQLLSRPHISHPPRDWSIPKAAPKLPFPCSNLRPPTAPLMFPHGDVAAHFSSPRAAPCSYLS